MYSFKMSVADLGEHLLVSIKSVIAARRQPREESFWSKHFYSKKELPKLLGTCLLYTSDAADE